MVVRARLSALRRRRFSPKGLRPDLDSRRAPDPPDVTIARSVRYTGIRGRVMFRFRSICLLRRGCRRRRIGASPRVPWRRLPGCHASARAMLVAASGPCSLSRVLTAPAVHDPSGAIIVTPRRVHARVADSSRFTRVTSPRRRARLRGAAAGERADEIAFFSTLTWIRRFGRPVPQRHPECRARADHRRRAFKGGFTLLSDDPPREAGRRHGGRRAFRSGRHVRTLRVLQVAAVRLRHRDDELSGHVRRRAGGHVAVPPKRASSRRARPRATRICGMHGARDLQAAR